jgi:hypothetical protein
MLLAVEATSGFILGVELLSVEGVVEDIWAQTPAKSLELLKRNQMRPARLELRTPWVAMVMGGLCKDLGIEMNLVPRLPALAQARRSLDRFNRR